MLQPNSLILKTLRYLVILWDMPPSSQWLKLPEHSIVTPRAGTKNVGLWSTAAVAESAAEVFSSSPPINQFADADAVPRKLSATAAMSTIIVTMAFVFDI